MRVQGLQLLVVASFLMAGACSDSAATVTTHSRDSPTSRTTDVGTVAPATTSPVVDNPTTTEAIEILLPANDVDDPADAIIAIFDYISYLAERPELSDDLLRLVYAETCECYDKLLADFDRYLSNGWVQDDQGIEVSGAFVSQEFDNGDVLLDVTYTYSPQYVREMSGNRIRMEEDEWTDLVSVIGLEKGADDRWRVGVIGIIGEGLR